MPFKDDKIAGINKKHGKRYINDKNKGEQPGRARLRRIFEDDLYFSFTASLVACLGSCCRTCQIMRCGLDPFGLMGCFVSNSRNTPASGRNNKVAAPVEKGIERGVNLY